MKIFKYILEIKDLNCISMPRGAEIISCQAQNEQLCLWARVHPQAKMDDRVFRIYGTGHQLPSYWGDHIHLATVQIRSLVWHVYEVRD